MIEGKWSFAFSLKAVEQNRQLIGQSVADETEGLAVIVESLEETPMSFSIDYTEILPEEYRGDHGGAGAVSYTHLDVYKRQEEQDDDHPQ